MIAFLVATAAIVTSPTNHYDVVPKPIKLVPAVGSFTLSPNTTITASGAARAEAETFAQQLAPALGRQLTVKPSGGSIVFKLVTEHALGAEGYALTVTPHSILATAQTDAGLFYAGQTLRQLLPPTVYGASAIHTPLPIPACHIFDKPRFSWRGLHLDVSRHFFPVPDIEKYIDLLAGLKMNVFHWHLTDDGGWRIQIKKYPLLTERGAWRSSPKLGWDQSKLSFPYPKVANEYGGFYTQAQVKQVIRYAAQRHVTIVPEIEMPGHELAMVTSYPFLGPETAHGKGTVISSVVCPAKDSTYKFYENVLTEIMHLFPSKFIHIGGDEVDKTAWNQCPLCVAMMKKDGMTSADQLQSMFVKRIEKFLNAHHRDMIGWDEILEGGLAPNATVMSWRGIDGGIAAAKQGKRVVMSPTGTCYFDYPYSTTPTHAVYDYEPVPAALNSTQAKLVLGAQGNVWTERMPTFARVLRMAYPRACALAETTWTPAAEKSYPDFEKRMSAEYARLTAMHVPFRLPTPTASANVMVGKFPQSVTILSSAIGGAKIHYTTNGHMPTLSSPTTSGKITVHQPAELVAALITNSGLASTPVHVVFAKPIASAAAGSTQGPGWGVDIYNGTFNSTQDFSGKTLTGKAIASQIDLSLQPNPDTYGLRFTGVIHLQKSGTYGFRLTSDDGSRLSLNLNGKWVTVVDNDGPHGAIPVTGYAQLGAGTYMVRVDYFQVGGAQSLVAEWQQPGETTWSALDTAHPAIPAN